MKPKLILSIGIYPVFSINGNINNFSQIWMKLC